MNKKQKIIVRLILAGILITNFCIFMGAFVYYQTEVIFYEKMAQLIATVAEEYPKAEQGMISDLKNVDETKINTGKEILEQYGYDEAFIRGDYREDHFKKLMIGVLGLIGLLFICFGGILLWYYSMNRRRITGLAEYLYHINEGDYIVKPQSNEDEFSILEDELYKTVVMLRETREAARSERENLAENLADISHQLKTPLTSIALMAELLEDSRKDSEDALYVQRISNQIDRLNQLVTALLTLSKLDAGSLVLEKKPVNVYEVISTAVEPLVILLENKGQKLNYQDDHNVWFKGDLYWSSEAIGNIIKNCIEHTPNGGEIDITYEQNPICTKILIDDQGEGFQEKEIPHLFTRFYKGQNAARDSVGIGLALAKSIIQEQNGEIRAENKRTGGARFIIKFYTS